MGDQPSPPLQVPVPRGDSRNLEPGHNYVPKKKANVLGFSRRVCGCCIVPQDGGHSIVVGCILVIPTTLFLVFVVPLGEVFSYIITLFLAIGALMCLIFAVTCDPGIIPPAEPSETTVSETVIVKGIPMEKKVCPTCHIVRPLRSSHCFFCDYCVEEYDHHCGLLGSCVGKRTFRFFAGFLWFSTPLCLFVLIRCIAFIATMDWSDMQSTHYGRWRTACAIVCCIISLVVGCCTTGQGVWYCGMACNNTTQKDQHNSYALRKQGIPDNIWDEGCCRNFWPRICGPLGESRV